MHNDLTTIDRVDFLPASYRKQQRRRINFAWQGAVAGLLLLMMSVTAWNQYRHISQLRNEKDAILAQHEGAVAQTQHLFQMQTELADDTLDAELYTYLQHPWPRTQLLALVVNVLPEGITLTDLEISQGLAGASSRPRARRRKKEKKPTLVGAAADLKTLRAATSEMPDRISLQGWTEDATLLHQYLELLSQAPLVQKTELVSFLRRPRTGQDGFSFHAQLTIKPGYGQTNGPKKPEASLAELTPQPLETAETDQKNPAAEEPSQQVNQRAADQL